MQEKRKKAAVKKRGYFLLEVLIAMALFALAVVPLLSMTWSILGGEVNGKKQFLKELEVKHHAISTLEAVYTGAYSYKTLEQGVFLDHFNGHMQIIDDMIVLTYVLGTNKIREFSIPAPTTKKNPQL